MAETHNYHVSPCPHCGGPVRVFSRLDPRLDDAQERFSIGCIDTKCAGSNGRFAYIYKTELEAIKSFNKRAKDTAILDVDGKCSACGTHNAGNEYCYGVPFYCAKCGAYITESKYEG